MAEQKKAPSTNGEFKTSPLGFDKAEVMAYIVQHNKERKALKEENDELKRALEEKQQANEGQNDELAAELEKKKAELLQIQPFPNLVNPNKTLFYLKIKCLFCL